jgi:hypothetical protein
MDDTNNQNFIAENAKNNAVGVDQDMPVNKFGMKPFTNLVTRT